jgi:cytochrome c5
MTPHAFKTAALCAALALATTQAVAGDGAQSAVEFGCLNCHGAQAHAAPKFRSLADKASRRSDLTQVAQHLLDEMHEKNAVHTHTMVSDDAARVVLEWVAQGMK